MAAMLFSFAACPHVHTCRHLKRAYLLHFAVDFYLSPNHRHFTPLAFTLVDSIPEAGPVTGFFASQCTVLISFILLCHRRLVLAMKTLCCF
jgi:hypothetical protein